MASRTDATVRTSSLCQVGYSKQVEVQMNSVSDPLNLFPVDYKQLHKHISIAIVAVVH